MATEQNRIAQPPDRYRLEIASEKPSVYELNRPTLRLGMDPDCEIQIKRDRTVSPVHATFHMRDGAWCLRDESSRHGITLVTSPGIAAPTRYPEVIGLAPGQTFRFGHTDVVFQRIRPPGERVEPFCGMVGTSPALRELTREIERIARRAKRLAVCGATGTGKELVARAIHKCSGRPGAFIALNCGAIPGSGWRASSSATSRAASSAPSRTARAPSAPHTRTEH